MIVAAPPGPRVEIQVRTAPQDVYAELVEKMSDAFGIELKYGGGDTFARAVLAASAQRADELVVLNRTSRVVSDLDLDSEVKGVSDFRERIAKAEERFRATASAIIASLGSTKERTE